ncbi:MAG TPA: glutamate mutase L [Jiangellales bacterium]|nr:glutamate mutase L [Jiangellales bacterium]
MSRPGEGPVACVDVGSTFTKGALVDAGSGELVATASVPTTLGSDVLDGVEEVRARLGPHEDVLACSSAGGGLRLAVVGYERAVTAEAGHRVGLSAGSRVVHVSAGLLDRAGVGALRAARPDVLLLVGGTDGGNAEVLLHNARRLAGARLRAPVVVAGNADARDEVVEVIEAGGRTVIPTANVLPRIGVLDPRPAREAIREVFIRHVIGGKGLTRRPGEFAAMVRAATPDAVLAGVEVLADGAPGVPGAGDVVVVDVGGATTDVYSVLTPGGEDVEIHREVVEVLWRSRTVEGDLGVRWSAPGVVAAAVRERLLEPAEGEAMAAAAARRAADPSYVPGSAAEAEVDLRLASLAALVAVRRHARPREEGEVRSPGRDLREVSLVVGSGGVLRHADAAAARAALTPLLADRAGGWKVPEHAPVAVDRQYVLAAAGLLAAEAPVAAARLATSLVPA